MTKKVLRQYQQWAVGRVLRHWNKSRYQVWRKNQVALIADTGTGKTLMAVECIRDQILRGVMRKCVVVSPSTDINRKWWQDLAVEFPDEFVGEEEDDFFLALYQSLKPISGVSHVILDEVHSYFAPTWKESVDAIIDRDGVKVLGLTATPDRSDGNSVDDRFQIVADLRQMRPALTERGYYSPPNVIKVELLTEDHAREVYVKWKSMAGDRKTIVFTNGLDEATFLWGYFTYMGEDAGLASGSVPLREREFVKEHHVIFNSRLFGQGSDIPGVSCVVVVGFPWSELLFTQRVGRATRPNPFMDALVLNFI